MQDFDDAEFDALTAPDLLRNLFPHLDSACIQAVLLTCRNNIDEAINIIYSTNKSSQAVMKPVCRHFLEGTCFRSDCRYSHDPDGAMCSFFLRGACTKGLECPFSHIVRVEIPIMEVNHQANNAYAPTQDDFPSLGGPNKPKSINFLTPTITYDKMVKKAAPPPSKNVLAFQQGKGKKKLVKEDSEWLSTGVAVETSYLKHRHEAIELALNRNKLFQAATQAYLSGNKAAAKALSLEANNLNNLVNTSHHNASQIIFDERNTRSGGKPNVIDLHGLHPAEAILRLDEKILQLRKMNFSGNLKAIVGTGHHSRGAAKVFPALLKHLATVGLKGREASLADGKGGILLIPL